MKVFLGSLHSSKTTKAVTIFVVEAGDNSENTRKRLEDRCGFYGVKKHRLEASGEALAHAVGKTGKVAAVAVTDENLALLILGRLDKGTN